MLQKIVYQFAKLWHLLLPTPCQWCSLPVQHFQRQLCQSCQQALPLLPYQACHYNLLWLPQVARGLASTRFDALLSVSYYQQPYRHWLQRWKFAQDYAAGDLLLQQVANLLLLRGNFGKPGAGIGPIRGHSNVQGDRTVGIDEKPTARYLDRVQQVFGFDPRREHGHHVVESIAAMLDGSAKVFIGMGGNFIHAVPDTERAYEAMRKLELTVGIATKLNRGHLVHGRDALILPVVARSEWIRTPKGEQFVTIEDAMSNVTASRGVLEPASEHALPEVEIVCRMAMAALPDSKVDWAAYMHDYGPIRDLIAAVYPDIYAGFNERIQALHGFHLDIPPRRRVWPTPNGKANILVMPGLEVNTVVDDPEMLRLATVRSHDQYNTTIYGFDDRYRGVSGRRDVVFLNRDDMRARGLQSGDRIEVESRVGDAVRRLSGFIAVEYDLPRGSAAMYYPEGNRLVPLDSHDPQSGTPAYKSIPVTIRTLRDLHADAG